MSSIILMVIVVAWALVLVPMLLNRHEAASEARSVDRFATAMRVLSRRSVASGDRRYVVVPPRPESSPNVVVNGTSPYAPPHQPLVSPSAPLVHPLDAVGRRRRVLLVLAALILTTGLLAVAVSPLLWIAAGIAGALTVAYLHQVRRVVAAGRGRPVRPDASTPTAAHPAASGYARAVEPPHFALPDNAVVIERQEDGSWRPVPVPLPTYVTAPVAPAVPAARKEQPERPAEEVQRRLAVND